VQLALALAALLLPLAPILPLLAPLGIANLLLLLLFGLRCALRRRPAAGVFSAALLVLLGGAGLLELRHLGLLGSPPLSLDRLLIGSALAMLLLSVGLAERLNKLKRQMLQAQAVTLATQRQSLRVLQEQERALEKRVAERTEALAAANVRLQELALRDALTGLANRMALCQHLEHAWQRAERRHEVLALILLDLDGFKPVNDRYGHEAGDQLLVQVGQRLQAGARTTDLVARLGGDEFVLVCEAIGGAEQAEALAARLLEQLGRPFQLSGGEVRIGASIGIGFARPPQGSCDRLLREADAAMYAAKAGGRNRIRLGQLPAPVLDASVQRDES
jgi:diguanylate cyclase (GGDEF)-like protein